MNTTYLFAGLGAAAAILSCIVVIMFRGGNSRNKVDNADAAAPEGWVPVFMFDPEHDGGDGK